MFVLRHRTLAGNVALLLTLALSLAIFMAYASGEAGAATKTGDVLDGGGQEVGTVTATDNEAVGGQVRIDLVLDPASSQDFSPLLVNLLSRNVSGIEPVNVYAYQDNEVNGTVYAHVYYTLPSGYVGATVYSVYAVYGGPGNVTTTVYLDLQTPPPEEPPGGGGGGGGGPTPPPANVVTDAGTVSVDVQNGVVNLQVDINRIVNVLARPAAQVSTEIVITVTKPTQAQGLGRPVVQEVVIPPAALVQIAQAGKAVAIQTEEVKIVLPPAEAQRIAQAAGGANVEVRVEPVAESRIRDLVERSPVPTGAAIRAAGQVLEIAIEIVPASGGSRSITSFEQPIELALAYDRTLASATVQRLGVYRLNEETSAWDYVGGRIDRSNGQVVASRRSLSTYAVLAYEKTFADLVSHWSREDVEVMAARHVARGMTEALFDPDSSVTRAQFAALVVRTLNLPVEHLSLPFSDVPTSAWFHGEVGTAWQAGIVQGYEDGAFRPDALISRQEMAAMIARAMEAAGQPGDPDGPATRRLIEVFADRAQIAPWAEDAAVVAVSEGIVRGRTPATFAPLADATRAEGTVMLKRLLAYLGEI